MKPGAMKPDLATSDGARLDTGRDLTKLDAVKPDVVKTGAAQPETIDPGASGSLSAHFDALYRASDDPWGLRDRWYEQRKRALVLAALPHRRYANAFEPGCANGELSAALAPRCDALRASDANPAAVALARQRLAGMPQVRVEQRSMPDDWPDERFDLIVVSELAYYLRPPALRILLARAAAALTPEGTLLACHWRRSVETDGQTGDSVHALCEAVSGLHRLLHHEEADFILDAWSPDPRSVAEREGLV
jgi:SAM-dependent methyltransferase